jgi:hypothetical protein
MAAALSKPTPRSSWGIQRSIRYGSSLTSSINRMPPLNSAAGRAGFSMTARIADMLGVDGESYDLAYMTYALR